MSKEKDFLSFAAKLIVETSDPNNTKEHYQCYLKKNHKIGKTIKNDI